jgi:hypothetical protein
MTMKRDDKAPKRDKKRRNRNGCASEWIYLPMAGLLMLAFAGGFYGASLPSAVSWFIIAGLVVGELARRLLDKAIRTAHTCGYEAAQRDAERAVIAGLKAHGVKVVRIDGEGVEQL